MDGYTTQSRVGSWIGVVTYYAIYFFNHFFVGMGAFHLFNYIEGERQAWYLKKGGGS